MMKNKFLKSLLFNVGLLLLCDYLFSERFLGLGTFEPRTLEGALSFIASVSVAALFIGGNWLILRSEKTPKAPVVKETDTPKQYLKALQSFYYKRDLNRQMSTAASQIERLCAKKEGVLLILGQYFDPKEMTYQKFDETLEEVCGVFFANVRRLTNLIALFDEQEYRALRANRLDLPQHIRVEKARFYNEQFRCMDALGCKNEEIITMLDNLLLEITKLDESAVADNEKIQILEDMRRLIENTKLYHAA